ncbi:unnamed protein product [Ixodes hexagonus]
MHSEDRYLAHRWDDSYWLSEDVWRPVEATSKSSTASSQKALRKGFLVVSALLTTASIALLATALLRPSGLNNKMLAEHHKHAAGAVNHGLSAKSYQERIGQGLEERNAGLRAGDVPETLAYLPDGEEHAKMQPPQVHDEKRLRKHPKPSPEPLQAEIYCFYNRLASSQNPPFTPRDIPAGLCTAAVYCCLDASSDGRNLTFPIPKLDTGPNGLEAFNSLLHRTAPTLKRLFAIGGHHTNYAHLNRALMDSPSRHQFIEAVLSWLQSPHLRSSGIVVHITHPERLSRPHVLSHFVLELASRLPNQFLVVTLPLSSGTETKYLHPNAYKKVNALIKMSHHFGNPAIGSCPNAIRGLQTHSLQKIVRDTKYLYRNNWEHFLKRKFLFTVSLAGYEYWVRNGSLSGMTRNRVEKHRLSAYTDICVKVDDANWNHKYMRETGCLTAWSGRTYVSSLSPKSFKFIEDRRDIKGLAVFDIEKDDFRGVCGSPYPMLRALRDSLK